MELLRVFEHGTLGSVITTPLPLGHYCSLACSVMLIKINKQYSLDKFCNHFYVESLEGRRTDLKGLNFLSGFIPFCLDKQGCKEQFVFLGLNCFVELNDTKQQLTIAQSSSMKMIPDMIKMELPRMTSNFFIYFYQSLMKSIQSFQLLWRMCFWFCKEHLRKPEFQDKKGYLHRLSHMKNLAKEGSPAQAYFL